VAGGGPLSNNVPALSAITNIPTGVAQDAAGNSYIASFEGAIYEVDLTGQLTLIAGTGIGSFSGDGGPAINADIRFPQAIAVDAAGNVFIADTDNNRIRRIDSATGIITTVAGNGVAGFAGDGGAATAAQLDAPFAVALDSAGNLFIADANNNRIRRVDAASGVISTVAGNGIDDFAGDGGPATSASLSGPSAVAVDASGNIFIGDTNNSRVRLVTAATGIISTVAGNGMFAFAGDGGPATAASLNGPSGLALDVSGNLFIADSFNSRVRLVIAATGIISTFAGNGSFAFGGDGGPASSASLSFPQGLLVTGTGDLLIADVSNNRIRRVDGASQIITTVFGSGDIGDGGLATAAHFVVPLDGVVDASGNLFIADANNSRIRRVDSASGLISTVAGNGSFAFSGDGGPASGASLNGPTGLAIDTSNNLFIVDNGNNRIRRVDLASGIITTIAGNGTAGFSGDGGPATSASLNGPISVTLAGSNLFITDIGNNRVRRVDLATGIITTIAGNGRVGFSGDGGPATSAMFRRPRQIAADSSGNLFIADLNNHRIRRVDAATQIITTVAGSGPVGAAMGSFSGDGGPAVSATLNTPRGVAADGTGNILIADGFNNRIRRVDASTGIITTVVGSGPAGPGTGTFSGDGGPATSARLNVPRRVSLDISGNIITSDGDNNRIRMTANP
jgi:sugar lactone lactonase YvrE